MITNTGEDSWSRPWALTLPPRQPQVPVNSFIGGRETATLISSSARRIRSLPSKSKAVARGPLFPACQPFEPLSLRMRAYSLEEMGSRSKTSCHAPLKPGSEALRGHHGETREGRGGYAVSATRATSVEPSFNWKLLVLSTPIDTPEPTNM